MAMERATRVDLVKTIESQKEQLQRYEKRLKDVVQAYKGLIKEKEALDASVKVLSKSSKEERSPRQPSRPPTTDDGGDSSAAESDTEGKQFDDPLQTKSSDVEDTEEREDQLQTLTASLLTLTQEKSKLEASYVSDKKRLMQENEELSRKLEEEKNKNQAELKSSEQTANELKNRIRSQQAEREKEQNDHASMLRELQRLLAEERNSKEQLENQLEDTTAALREKEKLLPNMSEHYETRIQEMTREVKSLRSKLQAMEDKAKEPSPLVLSLQTEVAELKKSSSPRPSIKWHETRRTWDFLPELKAKTMDLPVDEIKLARGTIGLGFNIRGGVDNPHIQGDTGIFVTKIREDGSAFKDGRLKEGDKVLEVNGKDLSRVTHQEAVGCFVNAGEEVNIKVQHGAEAVITKKLENSIEKQTNKSNPGEKGSSSWKLPVILLLLSAGAGAFMIWKYKFR